MVKETRHIFDLSDIKAVRYQCRYCKGEVVQELLKYKVPDKCPLCGEIWEERRGNVPMEPNSLLARAIQDVLRAECLPMTVRFEIEGEGGKTA